ncbi:MAG: isoaspartyl peptidase/L-asparaginase [Verrucomicrobia bacterium]|nr:isoaspartyl peptidase/L-asparaginase [Verrucomicrobiota bacterium]
MFTQLLLSPRCWLASIATLLFVAAAAAQTDSPMKPFGIVIHGGAGTVLKAKLSPDLERDYRTALGQALNAGHAVLARGGTSLDAVVAAVTIMEDSPLFNAGKGAVLNSDGVAELDASIMDGHTLAGGGVAAVKRVKNPIQLARAVMDKSPHVLFTSEGAENFAKQQGFTLVRNSYFITDHRKQELKKAQELEKKKSKSAKAELEEFSFGTVGAVALDKNGNLAAATSTGGRTNKKPGRVGDTPIIGAGTYANNATCAVSGTGHGEFFMRTVAAHEVSALMEHRGLDVEAAAREVIRKIGALGGEGGLIAIDRAGRVALPFNTSGMYRGHRVNGQPPVVEIFGKP